MRINNKTKATKLKRLFFLTSVAIAIVALILFLTDHTFPGLISVGVFSLWYLYFHVADYQFIEFHTENNNVVLRYFKAIRFGKTLFNSIEFPQQILKNAIFENSIFGKMSDLTLTVKTKKGIAEYPPVSLSAVKKSDRQKMADMLNEILLR